MFSLFGVLGAGVFTVMLLCAAIIVGFGIAFGMEVFSHIRRYFWLKKVRRDEEAWEALLERKAEHVGDTQQLEEVE